MKCEGLSLCLIDNVLLKIAVKNLVSSGVLITLFNP